MATYKSSKELEGEILSFGDFLTFTKFDLTYKVRESYLENASGSGNGEIFKQLAIGSKSEFVKKYYGYESNPGIFPECIRGDYHALTRVAIALFKLCEGEQDTNESAKESSPLYNVGDRVIIKSKYDPGCSDGDYGLFFTKDMLKKYGGQTVTISSVRPMNREYIGKRKLYTEPYIYDILEDFGYWNWDASMFSDKAVEILVKPKSTSSSKTSTTKKSTKTNKTIQSTMVVKYPIKLGELYKGEWGTSNPLLVSLRMSITSGYIHCFKELTTALWCYANVAYNTPMCIIEVLIPKYTLYWVGKHGDIAVRKAKYVKELNMY